LSSSAADLLRAAADRVVTDEDGNVNTIRLLAPLSEEEVAQLEARIPCVLPPDARELLTLARGFEGSPLESIDFSGLMDPIFEELFPCGLPVAHDGYGNYWVVDLTSSSGQWGPILYLCHDPAVVVYQCPDIATFVADVLIMAEPPHGGPIDAGLARESRRHDSRRSALLVRCGRPGLRGAAHTGSLRGRSAQGRDR
jgi:hypothetical protein